MEKKVFDLNNLKLLFLLLIIVSCGKNINISKTKSNNIKLDYRDYYTNVYKADSLYIAEKFKESFLILDSISSKFNNLKQTDFINEYETYMLLKQYYGISKKQEVLKLTQKFGYEWIDFKSKPKLEKLIKLHKIEKQTIDSCYQIYKDNIDIDLRNRLLEMLAKDQEFRFNKNKQDSIYYIDSLNFIEFNKIINNKGIPTKRIVGKYDLLNKKQAVTLVPMLIHFSYNINYNLIDSIIYSNLTQNGNFTPLDLAFVRDLGGRFNANYIKRYYISNKEANLILERNRSNEIDEINFYRSKIGLHSIQYQVWKYQMILNN